MIIKSRIFILSALLISGNSLSAEIDANTARTILKDYGLASCISSQFKEESEIKSDIGIAIGAYSKMGNCQHFIIQNEDTLSVIYDPYAATKKYMLDAYQNTSSISKYTHKKMAFYGCIEIYKSNEFDIFIKSQDQYLPK